MALSKDRFGEFAHLLHPPREQTVTTIPPDLPETARRVARYLISLADELTAAAPEPEPEPEVGTLLVRAPLPDGVILTGQQSYDLNLALDELAEKLALPFRWVAVQGGLSEVDVQEWSRNT